MHTESERKFLAWSETARLVVLLEASAVDESEPFVVDGFAREMAQYIGAEYIGDWVRSQESWRGGAGPAKWVNTNRRSIDETADAIREVWRRWMLGENVPPLASINGVDGTVIDRFGARRGSVLVPRKVGS